MLSTSELTNAVSDAGGYASAAWPGIFAVICFGIAFNVRDAAFRIHHIAMKHLRTSDRIKNSPQTGERG
ncbi:hypothetical protein [Streptomyces albipurpureus]|uniref:Uncharacterized protein n=1 Tax=Streptomyces albipurpureus TaxID=2897419 RepID=A0ABT0V221_9ACTN|nr:hypothetical protein [Streptomyces sp. CWNU-1]MCM2393608.1 hypothetical protein [Streptomyces sp. CWNU-1]